MWRFMAVTFAFLGLAFYQLSGGSDYQPTSNSIQAHAETENAQAPQVDVVRLDDDGQPEEGDAIVTRTISSLSDLDLSDGNRFQITLAAAEATAGIETDARPEPARSENVADAIATAIATANTEEPTVEAAEVPDSVKTGFIGEEVFSLETYVMRQNNDYTPTTEGSLGTAPEGDIRRVSGNTVNMRSGPGTDYEKVGRLSKGTQIAVLEEPGNGWVKLEVLATGETGWMADWLLTASN